mgnify:CR=1 FL=1
MSDQPTALSFAMADDGEELARAGAKWAASFGSGWT